MSGLTSREEEEIKDYERNVISMPPKINLASAEDVDEIYDFEDVAKAGVLRDCFFENRIYVAPQFRNCLSNATDKNYKCNDTVTHKAKEYRVICVVGNVVVMRNSKSVISADISDVHLKIKQIDGNSITYMYKLLFSRISSREFDTFAYFKAFVSVFGIDSSELFVSLDDASKAVIIRGMKES